VSENLDLLRSIYADCERGDYSRVDWADPEIEYVIADGPTPTTFRGLSELAAGMRESLSAWENLRARVDEYRELDEERVLVLLHFSGHAKMSGLDVDAISTRGADLVEIHDGKVTKIVKYYVLDRALADLGLAKQAVPEESSTPDLVEALRRSMGAVNRRDFDAAMILYAPNAVWDASPMGLDVFEGAEAIRGFLEEWFGVYEDFEQVLEEFRDLGNSVTLAVSRQRARLPGSGAFVELHYAAVVTWIDGLVERVAVYSEIDEARAAAERLAQERG